MNKNIKLTSISELKTKLKNKKVVFEKDNFWEVFSKCNKIKQFTKQKKKEEAYSFLFIHLASYFFAKVSILKSLGKLLIVISSDSLSTFISILLTVVSFV